MPIFLLVQSLFKVIAPDKKRVSMAELKNINLITITQCLVSYNAFKMKELLQLYHTCL